MRCNVTTNVYGNIWFKMMDFKKAGDFKTGHVHTHDHLTFVTNGSVEVWTVEFDEENQRVGNKKDLIGEYKAPYQLKVPAGIAHTVIALEDNTVAYCIEAIRDNDEVITTDFGDPEWEQPKMKNVDKVLNQDYKKKKKDK